MCTVTDKIHHRGIGKAKVWYDGGKVRCLARANGFVMFARPGCIPGTMPVREWDGLPDWKKGSAAHQHAAHTGLH